MHGGLWQGRRWEAGGVGPGPAERVGLPAPLQRPEHSAWLPSRCPSRSGGCGHLCRGRIDNVLIPLQVEPIQELVGKSRGLHHRLETKLAGLLHFDTEKVRVIEQGLDL